MKAYYSCGFNYDQLQRLKAALKDYPDLLEIVKKSYGTWVNEEIVTFRSPPPPAYSDPLPKHLHIGRKVRIKKGPRAGQIDVVTDHWYNGDDCSGGYGTHRYAFGNEIGKNNSTSTNAADCELIDE